MEHYYYIMDGYIALIENLMEGYVVLKINFNKFSYWKCIVSLLISDLTTHTHPFHSKTLNKYQKSIKSLHIISMEDIYSVYAQRPICLNTNILKIG